MSQQHAQRPLAALAVIASLVFSLPALAQVDADAAETLFKENDCHKCHHAEKAKKGPSLKAIAAKYKEKKLDEQKMVEHMLKGAKVKLEDGTEETHKIIDTKDAKAQSNLAKWILSH
jgi:cytochrome c